MWRTTWWWLGDPPGKSHAAAGPVGIPQDTCGDDLAEGLEHALQLLLVHGHRQVGDVEVGGVLLLLLQQTRTGKSDK